MIDIHCHILDGVDDGPQSLDESVELCTNLKEEGVSGIIATPHYMTGGGYMPSADIVELKVKTLNDALKARNIDLNIYPGMEIFADHEIAERAKNKEVLTLNNTKYILIEFPMDIVFRHATNIVFSLLVEGYIPIIAHPERYTSEYRKNGVLEEIVYNGALLQINSGSILGYHGKKVQKEALTLINGEMAHIVASDSHGQHRLLKNKDDLEAKLIKNCGLENTEKLMYTNPLKVLEDKEIEYLVKVKKSFSLTKMFKNFRYNT